MEEEVVCKPSHPDKLEMEAAMDKAAQGCSVAAATEILVAVNVEDGHAVAKASVEEVTEEAGQVVDSVNVVGFKAVSAAMGRKLTEGVIETAVGESEVNERGPDTALVVGNTTRETAPRKTCSSWVRRRQRSRRVWWM